MRMYRLVLGLATLFVALVYAVVRIGSPVEAQPTPPPAAIFAYRVVLTGPAETTPGAMVTYRVDYTLLNPQYAGGLGFNFVWPANAVSFVSSGSLSGPAGVASPAGSAPNQARDSLRWGLSHDG